MRASRPKSRAIVYESALIHRRVAALSLATVLVGAAWIARDVVLVRVFGLSVELDRFVAIVLVPTIIITLVAGALASTAVPEYMRRRAQSDVDASAFHWRLSLAGALVAAPAGMLATIALGVVGLMHLDWIAADPAQSLVYGAGAGIAAAAGVFGRLAAATMNVHERVFLQTALLCLPLIGPIVSALLWPDAGTPGLFAAFVAGSLLQAGIASVAVARNVPIRLRPTSSDAPVFERRFLRENLQLGLGTSLMSLSELVINALAAAIGPGALSQLAVSQRLPQLFQTFVGGVMATAAYPAIAREFIAGNHGAGRTLALRLAFLAGAVGFLAALAMSAASHPVSGLIVGTNSPLTDREAIAGLLSITAWQIPPAVVGIMLSRAVISTGNSRVLTQGAAGYLVAVSAMGVIGIQFGNVAWAAGAPVVGYAISAAVALAFVRRKTGVAKGMGARG